MRFSGVISERSVAGVVDVGVTSTSRSAIATLTAFWK